MPLTDAQLAELEDDARSMPCVPMHACDVLELIRVYRLYRECERAWGIDRRPACGGHG